METDLPVLDSVVLEFLRQSQKKLRIGLGEMHYLLGRALTITLYELDD